MKSFESKLAIRGYIGTAKTIYQNLSLKEVAVNFLLERLSIDFV